MPDEPRGEPGALLRPAAALRHIELSRLHPRPSLAPFVDYLWLVRWDLAAPHEQAVLTQPKIHVVAEEGRILVYGVSRRLFRRRLTGRGSAVGAAFRAGGLRPFLREGDRVGALEGRLLTGHEVWGIDDVAVAAAAASADSDGDKAAVLQDLLDSLRPAPDPVVDQVAALVDSIDGAGWLTRVDQLAAESGLSVRSLQRLFREYVGIGPKWVIQRRRLLEAAERVHEGEQVAWAALADDLGYSDQAHLVRDFTAAVGTPPATYARVLDQRDDGG